MTRERNAEEDRIVALHEAGHVVVGAAVAGVPEYVSVEPEEASEGQTDGTVQAWNHPSNLLVVTAGAAAESLWGPEPRHTLPTFLRTETGQSCWPEIRGEISRLTGPMEPFRAVGTVPPLCSDRDEAVDLIRVAFDKARSLLEEWEDVVIIIADRLQEERTLGKEELLPLLPEALLMGPGMEARAELQQEMASDDS